MSDNDNDDFEQLKGFITAAEAMHDLFISFTAAGFTENQALTLIAFMLKGN